MFTLFLFYSMVTPKCDVEIEKKKSNVNTFTLLFHLFFFVYFHLSSGICNVFTLFFFLFYNNISVCCWNRRALLNSCIWGLFCPSPAEAELVLLSAYPATHRPTLFKPYPWCWLLSNLVIQFVSAKRKFNQASANAELGPAQLKPVLYIFLYVTARKCNLFTLFFFFYFIVTPQCVVKIEK